MASKNQYSAANVAISLETTEPTPLPFPKREIILSSSKPVIQIGRASKVESKGFVAAKNNAWFDSQVMSRSHAEFAVDMEKQAVTIKDVGSLHGTYINSKNQRIESDSPHLLKHGDCVQFGVPIWRGSEKFPPTSVKVGVQFTAENNNELTRVFRAPEVLTDNESDEGSTKDLEVVEVVDEKPVTSSNTIDLTEPVVFATGPAEGYKKDAPIDLTSPLREPSCEPDEDMISETRSEVDRHGDGPTIPTLPPLPMTTFDVAVIHDKASPELDLRSPRYSPVPQPYEDDDSHSTCESEQDSIHLSEDSISDEDPETELSDSSDDDDVEMETESEDNSEDEIHQSQRNAFFDIEAYDSMEEEEHSSEDESIHEDDQGLFLWDSADDLESDDEDFHAGNTEYNHVPPEGCALPPIRVSVPGYGNSMFDASSRPIGRDFGNPTPPNIPVNNASFLPKPTACNIASILNHPAQQATASATIPTPAAPMDSAQHASAAEMLGHKSGKHDFFAAREANKMAMARQEPTGHFMPPGPLPTNVAPIPKPGVTLPAKSQNGRIITQPAGDLKPSDSPVSPSCKKHGDIEGPSRVGCDVAPPTMEPTKPLPSTAQVAPTRPSFTVTYTSPLLQSPLLDSGARFLNSPPVDEPIIDQVEQDEEDERAMTSAFAFSQRKNAQAEKANKPSLKRKSDEISKGDNPAPLMTPAIAQAPPETRSPASVGPQPPVLNIVLSPELDHVQEHVEAAAPPAKRRATTAAMQKNLKKNGLLAVAEKVGFAALGGAVVLGSLIYTAPSF